MCNSRIIYWQYRRQCNVKLNTLHVLLALIHLFQLVLTFLQYIGVARILSEMQFFINDLRTFFSRPLVVLNTLALNCYIQNSLRQFLALPGRELTTYPRKLRPLQKNYFSPFWGCTCTQCTPWLHLCYNTGNIHRIGRPSVLWPSHVTREYFMFCVCLLLDTRPVISRQQYMTFAPRPHCLNNIHSHITYTKTPTISTCCIWRVNVMSFILLSYLPVGIWVSDCAWNVVSDISPTPSVISTRFT